MSEPASSPVPAPTPASTRHPWDGAAGAILCIVAAIVLGRCAAWLSGITEQIGYETGTIGGALVHGPTWAYVLFGVAAGVAWLYANVAPRYERSRRLVRVVLSLSFGVLYAVPTVVFLRITRVMLTGS